MIYSQRNRTKNPVHTALFVTGAERSALVALHCAESKQGLATSFRRVVHVSSAHKIEPGLPFSIVLGLHSSSRQVMATSQPSSQSFMVSNRKSFLIPNIIKFNLNYFGRIRNGIFLHNTNVLQQDTIPDSTELMVLGSRTTSSY